VGIDEQRGHVGAVAGEGHEAAFGVGDWFFVGWIGVKGFHFFRPLADKFKLPTAFPTGLGGSRTRE